MSASDRNLLLEQTATRLFADLCTPELIAHAEAGVWPVALWQALETAGLTQMLMPEAGGTFNDAGVVLRLAGRFAAPVPLAETLLASTILTRAGLDVPNGPLTVAPVRRADEVRFQQDAGGWRLSGQAQRVPWARDVTEVVVIGQAGDVTRVARITPHSATLASETNLAGEPRDTISFDDVLVEDAQVAPAPPGIAAEWLLAHGALARTLQMAGALEQLLDLTVEYAQQRAQFGQPIGRLQVIQHQLVELAEHVAAARTVADLAAMLADQDDEQRALFAIAAAKARVSASVAQAASSAHQVHGALGFTQEYRLHQSTRRLWAWRDEFGSDAYWSTLLGRMTLATGADAFWPTLATSHQAATPRV